MVKNFDHTVKIQDKNLRRDTPILSMHFEVISFQWHLISSLENWQHALERLPGALYTLIFRKDLSMKVCLRS